MPPQNNTLDPDVVNLAKAVRRVESGDNFTARGKSGEFGAYQFTAPTWAQYSLEVLGQSIPLEAATPEQQNQVAYTKMKQWKDAGRNVGEVASMWNAGESRPDAYLGHSGVNDMGVAYDTSAYAQRVAEAYQGYKAGTVQDQSIVPGAAEDPTGRPTYGATFPYQEGDNALVAGFKALGNLPSSAYGFGEGIINMLMNPAETLTNIGNVAIGGVEKLTGDQNKEDAPSMTFDAFAKALQERYGGLDELTNTATNDPFGFGTDIASLLGGGAALVGKGAEAGALVSKVGQTVTGPVSRAAGTAIKPLAIGADEAALAATQRTGVTLPAAAYTKNPVIRYADSLASTGLGGSAAAARVEKAVAEMNAVADKIVATANGVDDIALAGENIAKGLEDFETAFRKTNDAMYGDIRATVGDVGAQTSNTSRVLNAIIDEKGSIGDTSNLKFFNDKRAVVTGGKLPDELEIVPLTKSGKPVKGTKAKAESKNYPPPTFDTLRRLRTNLGQMIDKGFDDPFVKGNIVQLKQLYRAISDDLKQTIRSTGNKDLEKAYDAANAAYIAGRREITSQFGKTIRRLAQNGQYSRIVDGLIKPSTAVEDIPRIIAVIGEKGAADLRAAFMRKVFEGARNAEGDFTPQGILRQIGKYGDDKVSAILTAEQVQGIKDIGTLSKALGDSLKVARGSQTAFLIRTGAELTALGGGVYALLTGNFPLAAQLIGGVLGAEGASYFFASPMGQKMLMLGITKGTEYSKLAGEMGIKPPQAPPEGGTPALAAAPDKPVAPAGETAAPNIEEILKASPRQFDAETFPKTQWLPDSDKAVEAAAVEKYLANRPAMTQEYLDTFDNVVSNDNAKRMFKDVGYKGTNSQAVHEAAGEVADDAFEYLLKTRPEKEVVFLAGGSGAGKSSMLRAAGKVDDVAAIYDGNLSKLEATRRRIEQVREAGKEPLILYVYRKPSEAWQGVIDRMLHNPEEMGRNVPLGAFGDNTRGALSVVRLMEEEGIPVRVFKADGVNGINEIEASKLGKIQLPKNFEADAAAQTIRQYEKGLISKEQRDSLIGKTAFDAPLREIVNEINNGGITYNIPGKKSLGGTPTYAVSPFPNRSLTRNVAEEGPLTLKMLSRYIQKNKDLLGKKDFSLGGWYDTDGGNIYLDVSITTADKAKAVKLGQELNQKAIFDLSKFEEIPTGGTGKPPKGLTDAKVLAILGEM